MVQLDVTWKEQDCHNTWTDRFRTRMDKIGAVHTAWQPMTCHASVGTWSCRFSGRFLGTDCEAGGGHLQNWDNCERPSEPTKEVIPSGRIAEERLCHLKDLQETR
ncbi:hypothetical protein M8818_000466 [Zalaria obscura]|uniref:Uncharacterized protein n=1 Tax=Zalaria obscura TaxID=2024903 RepID=A0ACC3SNF8_9PEZI